MILRCRAPRRRAKRDGETCGGFVARSPHPFVVVALIRHSDQADPGNHVAPCLTCGQLHEYRVASEQREAS